MKVSYKANKYSANGATKECQQIKIANEEEINEEAIHSFLSIITHEIRTPMNGILHTAQILHEDIIATEGKNSEKIEVVEILQQSSKRLLAFINDLSDFVMLENLPKNQIEAFSPSQLINKASTLFTAININKPITLKANSNNLNKQVFGEKKRIYQTIILMLLNLSKSISKGNVILTINIHETNQKNKHCQCIEILTEVVCPGINCKNNTYKALLTKNIKYFKGHLKYGCAEKEKENIFLIEANIPLKKNLLLQKQESPKKLFKQKNNNKYYIKKIMGCLGISKLAGITSNNTNSKNTSAPITIQKTKPVIAKPSYISPIYTKQQHTKKKEKNNNSTLAGSSEKNKTVLIIDDEEVGLKMVEMLLAKANISSCKMQNGNDALLWFKENNSQVKLVFMDIMLPDLSGYQLFLLFKEINSKVPIVAFSAENSADEITKMMRHGFYSFLPKPFEKKELMEIVQSV